MLSEKGRGGGYWATITEQQLRTIKPSSTFGTEIPEYVKTATAEFKERIAKLRWRKCSTQITDLNGVRYLLRG